MSIWVVLSITILLFILMVTCPYWGWHLFSTFRNLKVAETNLKHLQITATSMPMMEFVTRDAYGDKVVIYHHLIGIVRDFFSRASRTAIQQFLLFAIILTLAVLLVFSLPINQHIAKIHFISLLAFTIGATDVMTVYLFLHELRFVQDEIARYAKTLKALKTA